MNLILKTRMFMPGPTPCLPEAMVQASVTPMHHRKEDFKELFRQVRAGLQQVFKTSNEVLILACSGSGGMQAVSAALSTITASVVGVILNLADWFALHVVFGEVVERPANLGVRLLVPDWTTVDPAALVIAVGSFVALFRYRVGLFAVLGASMLAGVALRGLLG